MLHRRYQRSFPAHRTSQGLMEVSLVGTFTVVLIGVLAVSRDTGAVDEVGSQATARRLAVDLYQIERNAPRLGLQYTIEFSPAAAPDRYTIYRRQQQQVEVEAVRRAPSGVRLRPSRSTLQLDRQGRPRQGCVVQFDEDRRQQTVTLTPTGSVRLKQR